MVKSLKFEKERLLKQSNDGKYYMVTLSKDGKLKTFRVHFLVAIAFLNHTQCGHKLVVDHKDINNPLNKKDNRLCNLRIITARENTNQKHRKSSSKYTGVCWNKTDKKWQSNIKINGKLNYLGSFKNEYDAHLAYQNKLKEITNV